MAIKIIDEKPHKSVVKQKICRNCSVTLEYVPADVTIKWPKDISGVSDEFKYITCPKCSNIVEVY